MQHGQPKWPESAREQSLTLNQGLTRRSFFETVVDGLGGTALMGFPTRPLRRQSARSPVAERIRWPTAAVVRSSSSGPAFCA